jgi:hypothetical protein
MNVGGVDGMLPGDRRHVPGEIRSGDIQAGLVMVQCASWTQRSWLGHLLVRMTAERRVLEVSRRGHEAHAYELAGARHQTGRAVGDLHRGIFGCELFLEIEVPDRTLEDELTLSALHMALSGRTVEPVAVQIAAHNMPAATTPAQRKRRSGQHCC